MHSREEGRRRVKVATTWLAGASLAGTAVVAVTAFAQTTAKANTDTNTGTDGITGTGDLSPYNPGGTGFTDPRGRITNDYGGGPGPQARSGGS